MKAALCLLPLLAIAAAPDVRVLRWTGPEGSRPGTYAEWRAEQPASPAWNIRRIAGRAGFDNRVDVIVEDTLLPSLRPQLETLLLDLATEGFAAALFSCAGTSAESLKAFLRSERDSGLIAATLVGNVPVGWFQMIDDWNSNGRRDPDEGYEEFPCDLFLMDLDGIWEDNCVRYDTFDSLIPGADGIYDVHDGNIDPDIGISRMPASRVGEPDSLLRRYLSRCHAYRTGNLPVTDRALVYIDDDWVPYAPQWDVHVGMLYPERISTWDRETTRIADYSPRIDTAAYQWIALCSHSWPGGHAMKYNSGQNWDWFYATAIPGLNPEACFYNLFACSNVRFTENGYCGGMYVFRTRTGLAAIGSTKTGSMLEFQDYYYPLSQGQPLALAFREWFYWRAIGGFEAWERSWFYGMSLIGEGMLRPRIATALAEQPPTATRSAPAASIIRRILILPASEHCLRPVLLDPTGRKVTDLHTGANDIRLVLPGVYFLRSSPCAPARRIIILN